LGAFIVNGGKCSNVISFTPNINWPAAFATLARGGNAGGADNAHGVKKDNTRAGCKYQTENTGIKQNVEATRWAKDIYGPERSTEETEKSQMAHNKANNVREGIMPIEAELRIQGNPHPNFVDSRFIQGSWASIVVVNPFTIDGNWYGGCGDWMILADSVCNNILSNKHWRVTGVNHQIKEGSYVTTLKAKLDAPGIDIQSGESLGTDPDAYVPDNAC
jgi:hypothetical protein